MLHRVVCISAVCRISPFLVRHYISLICIFPPFFPVQFPGTRYVKSASAGEDRTCLYSTGLLRSRIEIRHFVLPHMSTSFARFSELYPSFPPHSPTVLHVHGVQSTRRLNLQICPLLSSLMLLMLAAGASSRSNIPTTTHEVTATSRWSSVNTPTSWI